MRRGLTLVEMLVALTILVVLGVVYYTSDLSSAATSSNLNADNVELAAQTLGDLSEAIGLYTNVKAAKISSYYQIVGSNPSALSQLTHAITTNDRNSCAKSNPVTNASLYTSSQVGNWAGQFFRRPLPTTGFLVAPGFFADDTLKRYSQIGPPFAEEYFSSQNTTTPGTLAIVMRNVKYQDAVALAQRFEGDQTGVRGAVRFPASSGNNPVTVEFHIEIHGC